MITHIDLFSGIGGFSLAADWVWGKENVNHIFCEIEPFAQKVLRKHWPQSRLYHNVKDFKYVTTRPHILTGGFPCQPYSTAGQQKGAEDDRALWPEMLRIIQETRPTWVIGENVAGFVGMALDGCISDLEGEGYEVQPLVVPACAINAEHRRDRVWILCHTDNQGESISAINDETQVLSHVDADPKRGFGKVGRNLAGIRGARKQIKRNRIGWNENKPPVLGVDNGLPTEMDRLKSLGNAIHPGIAYMFMQAIKDIEDGKS